MSSDITVVVPSIPPRGEMLQRALASVWKQELAPDAVIVTLDNDRKGAPFNRDAGLAKVDTQWVAFLDDDDELLPQHLRRLHETALESDADLVYPWFTVVGGSDPFPHYFGKAWNNDEPHQVPVTFLVKTDAIRGQGGFSKAWDPSAGTDPGTDSEGNRAGEDFRLVLRMCQAGACIVHLPEKTWVWHHHGRNTSGLPTRW